MKGWYIQYLEKEELWYLTKHDGNKGISFEAWYYTSAELLTDLDKYLSKTYK